MNFMDIVRPILVDAPSRIGMPVKAEGSPGVAFQIMLRCALSLGLPPGPAVPTRSGLEVLDRPECTLTSSPCVSAVRAVRFPPGEVCAKSIEGSGRVML